MKFATLVLIQYLKNSLFGLTQKRVSSTKKDCLHLLIVYCETLIHVFRTRELQASRGLIMWPTLSSKGLDWRLSSRSVPASVCVYVCVCACRGKELWKERDNNSVCHDIFLQFTLSVSTGPHWLCELLGVEWARRVSTIRYNFTVSLHWNSFCVHV